MQFPRLLVVRQKFPDRKIPDLAAEVHKQLGESGFQLEGLFNRLMHKLFDEIFSPRRQGAAAVTAGKAFDARKPNPFDLPRLAIQNGDAGFGEDSFDLLLLARMIIVVT